MKYNRFASRSRIFDLFCNSIQRGYIRVQFCIYMSRGGCRLRCKHQNERARYGVQHGCASAPRTYQLQCVFLSSASNDGIRCNSFSYYGCGPRHHYVCLSFPVYCWSQLLLIVSVYVCVCRVAVVIITRSIAMVSVVFRFVGVVFWSIVMIVCVSRAARVCVSPTHIYIEMVRGWLCICLFPNRLYCVGQLGCELRQMCENRVSHRSCNIV